MTTTMIAIAELHPSKSNPREHFDPVKLQELAASIGKHGVLQPLVVRRNAKGYEIVAGERRFRAAKLAAVAEVPVRVIEISDEDLLELQLIENEQRDDLTPMERARGYARLMELNPSKHTAEAIGQRLGKTARYVWDHVRLLKLIPAAQKLLVENRILAGHGFVLAKLTPEQQKRAISTKDADWSGTPAGGLWDHDDGYALFEGDDFVDKKGREKLDSLKPVSVRELEAWVARHVRFNPAQAAEADPLLYDVVKERVDLAAARPGRGKKVIQITHEYRAYDDIREDGTEERIYGSQAWKRADGAKDEDGKATKTCEHSVLGVHACGPAYGQAYEVCVNKDKCDVHWKAERAARAKKAKAAKAGRGADTSYERQQEQWRKEEEQRRKDEAAWDVAWKEIAKNVAAAVREAPLKQLLAAAQGILDKGWMRTAREALKPKADADGMLRMLVLAKLMGRGEEYRAWLSFSREAGPLAGDADKIFASAKAQLKAAEKAAEKKAAK